MYTINSLSLLVEQFQRLPGIGNKTAQRLAYYVLNLPENEVKKFTNAILDAHKNLRQCKICSNLTDAEICSICTDPKRDKSIICVLTAPKDVIAFEKTNQYNGLYHVLNGEISPMNGVSPEDIKIKELLDRLKDGTVKEVIMATNPTIEGEATSMYISRLIKPYNITVTRLAYGIPIGADLEYADEITLGRALNGRQNMI
ncbi:MAG: recombination mediator RecR [Clostridia bacterium]|nr:recombination mediator RecR [Clostridia bacterium]